MKRFRGFTLVEMVVSVGLFSVVMLVVTAAYLNLISLDRQSRGTNDLTTNLSFAVESMARNMRTGSHYACPSGGNGTCSQISFVAAEDGSTITYLLKPDGTIGECTTSLCTGTSAVSVTDPRIHINALTFFVRGVGTGDTVQPQVTFVIRGSIDTDLGKTTDFSIETGATQRLIEL